MVRTTRAAVLALVFALPAAACGDDDGSVLTMTTDGAVTTTEAVAAGESITTTSATPTTTPPPTSAAPETASAEPTASAETTAAAAPFTISSPAFENGGAIDVEYTCDGDNVSPELAWSGVPAGTSSLALLVNDPDAGGWVHWAAWNIPPDSTGFPKGTPGGTDLPDGTRQAANDFADGAAPGDIFPGGAEVKVVGYDGPCPPDAHNYVFTLFALSGTIDLPGGTPAADIEAVIADATLEGSLLDQAALTGEYTP